MRKSFNIILSLVLLTSVFSCSKDESIFKEGYGYLKMNLSANEEINIETKAPGEVYAFDILDAAGKAVESYTDHRELQGKPIKLKPGAYKINATTGENVAAGWDSPFYSGTKDVEVVANATATANVVCYISNVMVKIELDESIKSNFKKVYVTVENPSNKGSLVYKYEEGASDNTIDKDGYFAFTNNDLTYSVYLENNVGTIYDGVVKGLIQDVKNKTCYTLSFKVSTEEAAGATNITVSIDDTMMVKDQNFVINLNKKNKPVISGVNFELGDAQIVSLGSSREFKVNVTSEAGFAGLGVNHNNTVLYNQGIPGSFNPINTTDKGAINSAGITWTDVVEGGNDVTIDFTNLVKSLPLGGYKFDLSALDKQNQMVYASFEFTVIPDVETSSISVEPWAKHAILFGMWNTIDKPAGVGFEYKKVSESNWTKVTDGLQVDGSNYSKKITGLDPDTEYVFRTVSDKEASNEIKFTTEKALQIPNMNFDTWNGNHPYPNTDEMWWDSSNANGIVTNVTPESSNVIKGKSAKLETKFMFKLAAGSVYVGKFGSLQGTSGATLDFGRPYSCRPLTLKGWFDYSPVAINKTNSPYNDLKGQNDICEIYCVLTDWNSPFTVNTSTQQFIDFANDPNIIAYGSLTRNTDTNGMIPFEIELKYRNKRTPKYCVLVCSSSKYGDYFTGGQGSILYVDEFEFTF